MAKRKTANEKLAGTGRRELVEMPANLVRRFPGGKLLIPIPTDLRDEISTIPFGSVRTIAEIRDSLAERYGAVATCAMVSGMFWRLVAEAAEEDRMRSMDPIAPYWRVVKDGGVLNDKLPGGTERQAALLEAEGHTIVHSSRTRKPVRIV